MSEVRLSRVRALQLLAGLAIAPVAACGKTPRDVVKIGSKNFTEELLLGEMYSLALERAGLPVERRLNLGGTEIAMASLLRGEIDIYPEYTGTALLVQLKLPPDHDRRRVFETVKAAYRRRYRLEWLDPAPMNDTQALAMTSAVSAKFGVRTLSECAGAAGRMRLGAVPEFTRRPDGLPGLQKAYGGFHFASIKLIDIGLKYKALLDGDVDVVVAFGTDGAIDADHLVVLEDDKHLFPPYQVAPVVRQDALDRRPQIKAALNPIAPLLTDAVMRHLNWRVEGNKEEAADVARDFLVKAGALGKA